MPEHERDKLDESLADSLADSLIEPVGLVPQAGPLPGALRDRLHSRRRARRARLLGGAAGVVGAAMLAVALLVWFGPPAASPTEPAPPNSVVARNDPPTSPDQPREDPEPEPLRFDDPMFAALDRGVDTEPVSDRWSIGSYLRGELPGGL